MEHLLDATITKAYKAKKKDGSFVEGEGEYGAWRLYNFYTDKTGDRKFSFMWGGKKPIPYEGLKIKHLEYEIKIDGEHTNSNVEKIEVDPDTPPMEVEPKPSGSLLGLKPQNNGNGQASFYVSYMKDVAIAVINCGGGLDQTDLDAIARKIAKAGLVMMNESLGNIEIPPEKPKTAPPSDNKDKPKGKPSIDESNDPRKDLVKCEFVKEDGTPKHDEPVSAIFCLTSCMETKHCSMAGDLREKYPGYDKE